MLTRRNFMLAGAIAGAGLAAPWPGAIRQARADLMAVPLPASPILTRFLDPLPIPPAIPAATPLTMVQGAHSFHSQLAAGPTLAYNGASYLGPTRVARKGEPVSFPATNQLGRHPVAEAFDPMLHGYQSGDETRPRAAVHLHGGYTEAASDGLPEDTFRPGEGRAYNYANDQEAALLFYHDHALGITRLNVYAGLAGAYILRDQFDTGETGNPLGLPAGDREVPLVIQDRSFHPDGRLFYPASPWQPEFFGDVPVVNGKAWPYLEVSPAVYRFRLVNGSNARFYRLGLSNRQPLYQIGTDSGLLNAPVRLDSLLLGPGERADLLVDFRAAGGQNILLTNDAPTPFPGGKRTFRAGGLPLPEILQFRVRAEAAVAGGMPTSLRGGSGQPPALLPLPISASTRQRTVTLVEIMGAAGPLAGLLNAVQWHEATMDEQLQEQVRADSIEIWNIVNLTGDSHPIHLHLVHFQILNRQPFNGVKYLKDYQSLTRTTDPLLGNLPQYPPLPVDRYLQGPARPPAPNEAGWKDTVRADPGEVTRIVVPFGRQAAPGVVPFGARERFTGRYVWHCHILEHEDNDMMLPYEVQETG